MTYIYTSSCRCDPLTDADKQPGAVIEVCDSNRCRKHAEARAFIALRHLNTPGRA